MGIVVVGIFMNEQKFAEFCKNETNIEEEK
jgi:hypothetical protein